MMNILSNTLESIEIEIQYYRVILSQPFKTRSRQGFNLIRLFKHGIEFNDVSEILYNNRILNDAIRNAILIWFKEHDSQIAATVDD